MSVSCMYMQGAWAECVCLPPGYHSRGAAQTGAGGDARQGLQFLAPRPEGLVLIWRTANVTNQAPEVTCAAKVSHTTFLNLPAYVQVGWDGQLCRTNHRNINPYRASPTLKNK